MRELHQFDSFNQANSKTANKKHNLIFFKKILRKLFFIIEMTAY